MSRDVRGISTVTKFYVALILIFICSFAQALTMDEDITMSGRGLMDASTDCNAVHDRVYGAGENLTYQRVLTAIHGPDDDKNLLESKYHYESNVENKLIRNSMHRNNDVRALFGQEANANLSGKYEAKLTEPNGITHQISVSSNKSIDSTSSIGYDDADVVSAYTNYETTAIFGNLSEYVQDLTSKKTSENTPKIIATTKLQGNFTLKNHLEDSQITTYTPGFQLNKLESTEMSGENSHKEIRVHGRTVIIMGGKEEDAGTTALRDLIEARTLILQAEGMTDKTQADITNNEALNKIDAELTINTEDSNGWYLKGRAFQNLNRNNEAIDAFSKALLFDKSNLEALLGKGDVLYATGQYQDAIPVYLQYVEVSKTQINIPDLLPRVYLYLGSAYKKLNDITNARKYLNSANSAATNATDQTTKDEINELLDETKTG